MKSVDECPACSSMRFKRQVAIDSNNRGRFLQFSKLKYEGLLDDWLDELRPEIAACDDCGHHWYVRQPSPDQLALMYSVGRPLLPGTVSREPAPEMMAEMRRLKRLSGKATPRLLDFGSGFGRWARAAARAGFCVYAYEPSEARGAEQVDEFTLVHDLNDIAGMRFDVINLEQVLEHVSDPIETLKLLKPHFLDGAVLRVSVPNILRPPERYGLWLDWPYNGRAVHIMAPFEHLHGFTPKSLGLVLVRAGYVLMDIQRLAHVYPTNAVRRIVGHFFPQFGQTLALAKADLR